MDATICKLLVYLLQQLESLVFMIVASLQPEDHPTTSQISLSKGLLKNENNAFIIITVDNENPLL